jgi:hypothetical protein
MNMTNECGQNLNDRDMKKQMMEEAKMQMEREFVEIMRDNDTHTLRWTGTQSDLMEIVHTAYLDNVFFNDNGNPETFISLVRRVCDTLHVSVPANPRAVAYQARCRKGFRQLPFLERYASMLYRSHVSQPLNKLITKAN